MTNSGFFRSRPKGRFKREDAGDLGISSYKRQQQDIINAQKENLQSLLKSRDQTERGLEGVGRSELFNQQVLNDLRNQKFQTRNEAIRVAKRTELQKIEDQAKIYGQESQWLQEWAPKFYQNMYGAITKTSEAISRFEDDKKFAELLEDDKFNEALNQLNTLDKDTFAEASAQRNKAFLDKDTEAVEYLRSIMDNSSSYLSEKIANQLIDQTDSIEAQLKRYVTGPNGSSLDWKAESVVEYYKMRGRELIKLFGLTGVGAQKINAHFTTRGAAVSNDLADLDKLVSDRKIRFQTSDSLLAFIGDEEKLPNLIQQAIITYRDHSYRQTKAGGEILVGYNENTAEAAISLFKDIGARGKLDKNQLEALRDKFLDSVIPGSTDPKETWRKRYTPKKEGATTNQLEEQFDDAIIAIGQVLDAKQEAKKKANDALSLTNVTNALNGTGEYAPGGEKEHLSLTSITTKEQIENAVQLYSEARKLGNTETMKALGQLLYIQETDKGSDIKNIEALWRASLTGDMDEVALAFRRLKPEVQARPEIQSLYKPAVARFQAGLTAPVLENQLKKQISSVLKMSPTQLKSGEHPSADKMLGFLEQDWHVAWNDLVMSGKYKDDIANNNLHRLKADVMEIATQDLRKGEGFYQRRPPSDAEKGSGQVHDIFIFTETKQPTAVSSAEIRSTMAKANGKLTSPLVVNAIKPTELKFTYIEIQEGRDEVTLPHSIHLAYELSDKSMSKTEFVNFLLESHKFGAGTEKRPLPDTMQPRFLKDGQNDILEAKLENIWQKGKEVKGNPAFDPDDKGITSFTGGGPAVRVNDRDVVQRSVYADIVNQTGQMPMKDVHQYMMQTADLGEAMQLNFPQYEERFSVDFNGMVNIPLAAFSDVMKNRHEYGLKVVYTADGGIAFQSRMPAHLLPGAVPPERTPSPNIADTSVEPEYFLQEQVEDR